MSGDHCDWGCGERSDIGQGFELFARIGDVIRGSLRVNDSSRDKINVRINSRTMLRVDQGSWERESQSTITTPRTDPIELDGLLQPIANRILGLMTKAWTRN